MRERTSVGTTDSSSVEMKAVSKDDTKVETRAVQKADPSVSWRVHYVVAVSVALTAAK